MSSKLRERSADEGPWRSVSVKGPLAKWFGDAWSLTNSPTCLFASKQSYEISVD